MWHPYAKGSACNVTMALLFKDSQKIKIKGMTKYRGQLLLIKAHPNGTVVKHCGPVLRRLSSSGRGGSEAYQTSSFSDFSNSIFGVL